MIRRLLGIATLLWASTGSARAQDAVRLRAKCADLELSAALGESVSAADKAACAAVHPVRPAHSRPENETALSTRPGGAPVTAPQSASTSTPAPKPATTAPSESKSTSKPASNSTSKSTVVETPRPEWIDAWPLDDGTLFGVGSGVSLELAQASAMRVLAAQLQAKVSGMTTSTNSTSTRSKDGKTVDSRASSSASSMTALIVDTAVQDVRVREQWRAPDGAVWALVALDLRAVAQREDTLVTAVLEALGQVERRVADLLRQPGALSYTAVIDAVESAHAATGLGRSELGRRLRPRWKSELDRTGKTLGRLSRCVEIEGDPSVPGAYVARCRGHAWDTARLRVAVEDGVGKVPPVIETDAQGHFSLDPGLLYGTPTTTALTFQLDLGDRHEASWLMKPAPLPASRTLPLSIQPGQYQFEIETENPSSWRADLAAALRSTHGLSESPSGPLQVNARVAAPQTFRVGSQWTATVVADWQIATPEGVALATRRVQGSGAAGTEDSARARALEDLHRQLRKTDRKRP